MIINNHYFSIVFVMVIIPGNMTTASLTINPTQPQFSEN